MKLSLKAVHLNLFHVALAAMFFLTAILLESSQAQIYVADSGSGRIGKYTTSGAPLNASLITGLPFANGLALDENGFLYVSHKGYGDGRVGKYTTNGVAVNASLITSLASPTALTYDQGYLYVSENGHSTVGKYTVSGAPVNAPLLTGFFNPDGLTTDGAGNFYVSDFTVIEKYTTSGALLDNAFLPSNGAKGIAFDGNGHIFVPDQGFGKVALYNTSGQLLNPALISGLSYPFAVAYAAGELYIAEGNNGNGRISKFTASGEVVNAALITGLTSPVALIVVPEPSTLSLILLGLSFARVRRHD